MRDREFERAVERAVKRAVDPGIGCQGCGCLLVAGFLALVLGMSLLGDLFLWLEGKDRERAPAYQAFDVTPPELRFRKVRLKVDEAICGPRKLGKGKNEISLKEGRYCLIKLTVRNTGKKDAIVRLSGVVGTEAAGTNLWGRGLNVYPEVARAAGLRPLLSDNQDVPPGKTRRFALGVVAPENQDLHEAGFILGYHDGFYYETSEKLSVYFSERERR